MFSFFQFFSFNLSVKCSRQASEYRDRQTHEIRFRTRTQIISLFLRDALYLLSLDVDAFLHVDATCVILT